MGAEAGADGGQADEFLTADLKEGQSAFAGGLGDGREGDASIAGGFAQAEPGTPEVQRGVGFFDGELFQVAVAGDPAAAVGARATGGYPDFVIVFVGAIVSQKVCHFFISQSFARRLWTTGDGGCI